MKRLLIPLFVVLLVGLSIYLLLKPAPLPTSDLASPSQEVRDTAAKVLRAKAKPPWKIKWFFFTRHIKAGEIETNILDLLRSYKMNSQPEWVMGGLGEYHEYRLDDYWLLGCAFNNNDKPKLVLEKWKLIPRWRVVAVWPSTNFTGVWINYHANGQKFTEGHYKDGNRSGEFTSFDSNGQRTQVIHYDNGAMEGLYTDYFSSSGRIRSEGEYRSGAQVGLWVTFNEDGTTNSVRNYSKP